jgi:hypothetical protein
LREPHLPAQQQQQQQQQRQHQVPAPQQLVPDKTKQHDDAGGLAAAATVSQCNASSGAATSWEPLLCAEVLAPSASLDGGQEGAEEKEEVSVSSPWYKHAIVMTRYSSAAL